MTVSERRYLSANERGNISVRNRAGAALAIDRYDNKARMYDPRIGRFVQPDPIGYADDANLYAYVGNDPGNFVDPLGLWSLKFCSAGFPDAPWGICPNQTIEFGEFGGPFGSNGNRFPGQPPASRVNPSQNNAEPQSNSCGAPSLLPHGLGLSVGGSADAGVPGAVGAGANGSAGVGAFYSGRAGGSVGAFAGGGAAAYAGGASASAVGGSRAVVAGASAGVGVSGFITNAQSAQQLAGPFTTYSLNVGFGPIQGTISLSVGGGIYQLSVSPPLLACRPVLRPPG